MYERTETFGTLANALEGKKSPNYVLVGECSLYCIQIYICVVVKIYNIYIYMSLLLGVIRIAGILYIMYYTHDIN